MGHAQCRIVFNVNTENITVLLENNTTFKKFQNFKIIKIIVLLFLRSAEQLFLTESLPYNYSSLMKIRYQTLPTGNNKFMD